MHVSFAVTEASAVDAATAAAAATCFFLLIFSRIFGAAFEERFDAATAEAIGSRGGVAAPSAVGVI